MHINVRKKKACDTVRASTFAEVVRCYENKSLAIPTEMAACRANLQMKPCATEGSTMCFLCFQSESMRFKFHTITTCLSPRLKLLKTPSHMPYYLILWFFLNNAC